MSKIATYSLADSPLQLSDRLIGTEAPRPTPSATPLATKNFSLGELLQLFSTNFPAYPLQDVLDENNTATQDINLTGTINVTLIKPTNIEDMLGSQGTPLQILSKGVGGICWIDIPNVSGFVPTSRELTINGVTYDLSANRSWTISGATWGSITGTISSQTDLISFLDGNFYPLSSNPAGYITQDNVVEYPDLASFPPTGVIGTVYIALDTGLFYSWNGTTYVLSSPPDTGITGVGTTNTYSKFTSPTTIGNGRLVDGINGGVYTFSSQWINLINGGSVLRLNRSQSFMEFTLGVQNFFATTIYSSQAKEGLVFDSQGDFAIGSGGPLLAPTQRLFIDRTTGNIHIGGAANVAASEKLQVTGNLRVTGAFLDSSNSAGLSGQILSSTLTGTQWINAPTGGVVSVAALTIGTSGTDLSSTVANPTTTPVITLNVPTASAFNRGVLLSADWIIFNNKQTDLLEFQTKQGFYLFEDFIGNPANSNIGTFGVTASTIGTGAVCTPTITYPNRTNQQGVMQLGTGTTLTGSASLRIGDNNNPSHYLGNGVYTMQYWVNIETLSTLTERFYSIFGAAASANFANTNGIFFLYDEGVGFYGAASPNFRCITRSSLVGTVTTTSVPVVASQWYLLKIVINATATSVEFFINNVSVATHTTNIPQTITPRIAHQKTIGITNRNSFVDYMLLQQIYTTPRTI